MNKIRTILVDDEPPGLSSLQIMLESNCPELEIVSACDSADTAIAAINNLRPELVFLDIAMPEKDGFDLLNEIGRIDFEIIFVTAHNDFMLQALRFSAVDYLLKPAEEHLLCEAVKRAVKKIEEKSSNENLDILLHNLKNKEDRQKMKICIPSLKGFQVVNISDIIYCEASSNYTIFHFTNKSTIVASRPIHEYEALLEDSGFVRIHKSFVINLEHVKEYLRGEGGTVILSNSMDLEVSRRKKENFIQRMKEFYKF